MRVMNNRWAVRSSAGPSCLDNVNPCNNEDYAVYPDFSSALARFHRQYAELAVWAAEGDDFEVEWLIKDTAFRLMEGDLVVRIYEILEFCICNEVNRVWAVTKPSTSKE